MENEEAAFSLYRISEKGLDMFKKIAGDWFGTNSISQVLKTLNSELKPFNFLQMCVFNDGIVSLQKIVELNSDIVEEQETTPHEESKNGEQKQSGGSEGDFEFSPAAASEKRHTIKSKGTHIF